MTQNIAILGMGKMGQALAERLLDQKKSISIWNRSKKDFSKFTSRGATVFDNPASAWTKSDVAITFLANDDAVHEVYLAENGLLNPKGQGRLAIEMSTISPQASASVAEKAKELDIDYLSSPVSGNPGVLAAGNLALIVSGPKSAYKDNLSLLESIGSTVIYVGENEESRILKLTVNATLAATAAIVSETILLCESNGIDRATYLNVLSNSSMGSPFVKYKAPALEKKDYSATFTTAMIGKDMKMYLGLAKESKTPAPITEAVQQLIKDTCEYGLADLDFMAILPYLQSLADKKADVEPN